MSRLIDLTGQKFGRLTVVGFAFIRKGQTYWNCLCDCGNLKTINGMSLRSSQTKSCGCFRKEKMADLRKKHGFRYSRIYGIWKGIKTRCGNPNRRDYQSYGGRGIKICKDLERFQPFYDWALSNGYADDLSIDRIDNDKGYSPDNCRWATAKEQSINRRNVALLLFNGKTQCVTDWAKELGLEYKTVFARIKRGWSLEQSLGLLKKKEAII